MARGRMVNKKISNSKRVNDLPLPAQLLYTWIIPHLDCNGVFYGDAQMVRSLVFPRKKYSVNQIESWLKQMEIAVDDEGIPLIIRYKSEGELFLCMPGFEGEQVGLRKDKEKPEYPLPPDDFRNGDGKLTENIRKNVGVRGREGEVEQEQEEKEEVEVEDNNPPIVPPSESSSSSDLNIFQIYEQEIGKLTPLISEELKEAEKLFGAEKIRDAIEIAAKANTRKWSYIAGILENWHQEAEEEKLKDYASTVHMIYRARKKALGEEPPPGELSEIRLRVKEALLRGETQKQILERERQNTHSKKRGANEQNTNRMG